MGINLIHAMDKNKVRKFGNLIQTIDFKVLDNITDLEFKRKTKLLKVGEFIIGGTKHQVNLNELDQIIETAKAAKDVVMKTYRFGQFK